MLIKTFEAGPLSANNYLVIDENTNEAMIIDCSDYVYEIVETVAQMNLNVKYILTTHGHFDHVLGINEMKEALNAEVYVSQEDVILIENIKQFSKMMQPDRIVEIPVYDKVYTAGTVFNLGKEVFNVIKTPGHTEGSVSIKGRNVLFSGDTLFRDGYGRTDLFGGNADKLIHSITNVIFYLPPETVVYPGHGPSTTIEYEKTHNDINKYAK